ncbi:SusD/RagB family nutrient-binding outer membrane lipoprotein [Marinoscillum furvescens]|nr:SusD/RagB family nutrient-binding outer membrane lipoprotein [Marinoscillum furvescens]
MKAIKYIAILVMTLGVGACTSDFEEINTNPNHITTEEASAKFFLTGAQFNLYGPGRYAYWRAQLIHADRYAGQFTFGFNASWWNDGLGYTYNPGYTDAAWDWLAGYFGDLDNYMKLTATGGDFENPQMYAVGQIISGLYYQMYTDTFGQIPYSEVGDPEVLSPRFDDQATIYQGVINKLDEAMATIGDTERTGVGIEDLGANDIYCGGDLQQWKRLANTLKLRMALRAHGASGASFAETAISEALSAPLLETDVLMQKDNIISQWASAAYGDVWHNFGAGSNWKVSKPLVDYLQNHNDPRLGAYAQPIAGGEVTWVKPSEADNPEGFENFDKRVDFIVEVLTEAGANPTVTREGDEVTVSVEAGAYVGQPVRLNGFIKQYVQDEFFSNPAEEIVRSKGGEKIPSEIVFTSAEAYFLQAEAAVKGLGSGDAQTLYETGIAQSMRMWGVSEGQITTYLENASIADLSGTTDEQLEKIAVQRWIASYTDGFEAWAVVRDMGYPSELSAGVSDPDIFAPGDINGAYPMRMQYGNAVKSENGDNYQSAISAQGPDKQDVALWWAK